MSSTRPLQLDVHGGGPCPAHRRRPVSAGPCSKRVANTGGGSRPIEGTCGGLPESIRGYVQRCTSRGVKAGSSGSIRDCRNGGERRLNGLKSKGLLRGVRVVAL
jgi:hypothetical protein